MTIAIKIKLALIISVFAFFNSNAHANEFCKGWPNYRDGQLITDYKKAEKDYSHRLDSLELWQTEFDRFIEEDGEWKLKVIKLADVLLVGAKATADVVSAAVPTSQATNLTKASQVLDALKTTEETVDLLTAGSTADALYSHVRGASDFVNVIGVFNDLLEAKDRYEDRESTMRLLQDVNIKLEANLIKARSEFKKSEGTLKGISKIKNMGDKECNVTSKRGAAFCAIRGKSPLNSTIDTDFILMTSSSPNGEGLNGYKLQKIIRQEVKKISKKFPSCTRTPEEFSYGGHYAVISVDMKNYKKENYTTYAFGYGASRNDAELEAIAELKRRNWSWTNTKHGYEVIEQGEF